MFSKLGNAWRRFWSAGGMQGAGIEALEQRVLLSGDALAERLMADGFEQVLWNGQQAWAVPGQWIVQVGQFPGNATAAEQVQRVNAMLGEILPDAASIKQLGSDGLFLMQAPQHLNHGQLNAALRGLPGFRFAEPDFAVWVNAEQTLPNDQHYQHLWAMPKIQAPETWSITTGSQNVIVAVIDSGVDYTHPDLAGNMWIGPGGIHGWNFVNNTSNPMDDNGHGTHVAGTLGAVGNNGIGVAGVNWNVQIMALKFLDASGSGTTSAAIQSINFVTDMKNAGYDVVLSNNSWGGGGYSAAMENAIRAHGDAGLLFVAAAGNNGLNNDMWASYPANYKLGNVISVAASDSSDKLANWSNYGKNTVHLAAPGVNIASTYLNGTYAYMSGTSMAAPHVAGVAALAWAVNPDATYQQVRQAILEGVDPISGSGNRTTITRGRLNAFNTVQLIAPSQPPSPPPVVTAPAAPAALEAVATSSSAIALTWTDNSNNEDGFRIEFSLNGTDWSTAGTVGAGVTSYQHTGRSASTTYHYRVFAYNSAGDSSASNIASATTQAAPVLSAPTAPSGLTAQMQGKNQIRLDWNDNSSNEQGFRILRSVNGGTWTVVDTVAANTTTWRDRNVSAGRSYEYRIEAFNAGGSSYSNVAGITISGKGSAAGAAAFSNSSIRISFNSDGDDSHDEVEDLILSR